MVMEPRVGGSTPSTILSNVLLPQPLGPMMDTNSPRCAVSAMSSSAAKDSDFAS